MLGRRVSGHDWLGNDGRFSANRAFILPVPDKDTAHWAGIENSLGDYIAVVDPLEDDVSKIPEMLEKAVSGFDVVFAVNSLKPKQSLAYRCGNIISDRLYYYINGMSLADEAPRFRVLENDIQLIINTEAKAIKTLSSNELRIEIENDQGGKCDLRSKYIFNCSYSGLNNLAGEYIGTKVKLKHEVTELALIDVPMSLKNFGITVMYGLFFQ